MIESFKNYDNRARKLGYDGVVDRFDKGATFALRMVEQGHTRKYCVLPEFPRRHDQRLLGVGPGTTSGIMGTSASGPSS